MSQNRPQASTRSRPATLREVADRAGVSLSTASRALDPDFAYVADAVRERVRQASADLDYHPNLSARAISGGTTSMLAILVSDLQDSANADLIYSVMERGAALDLVVMIAEMGTYVDQSVRVVHRLRQMKPQAMLLAGSRLGPPAANEALDVELGRYVRSGGRVVVVGDDELNHDSVVLPRRLGAYDLVVALAERGYRNASLIDYDSDSTAGRAWLEGIADAARQTGMRIDHSPEPVLSGSREAGQAAMAALIQTSNDIDVVIASTDMLAIGAMRAMRQAGIEPGSGLAVAGFGNALNSSDVLPSLTTVDLSLAKAGVAAVDLAVGAAGPQPVRLAVDARVLIRDSTPER